MAKSISTSLGFLCADAPEDCSAICLTAMHTYPMSEIIAQQGTLLLILTCMFSFFMAYGVGALLSIVFFFLFRAILG